MQKFPKIRYPNDQETDGLMAGEVVVTEKLDGANFRFAFEDELKIGTRNHVYTTDDPNFPKAFEHARDWLLDLDEGVKEDIRHSGVFYGEAMHLHSLHYEDVEYANPSKGSPYFDSHPNVVLFDWVTPSGEWADWDEFVELTDALDLPTTQVLERGDPEELTFEVPEESMFGGPPEGIVARRVDGSVRAKKVTDDFKEKNAISFEDESKAQSDSAKFVATYITEARIEKMAHKLVDLDEYDELQMAMMEDLPREVLKDAMVENAWELMSSDTIEVQWDADFTGGVRSKASKKCARVLKTMMQEF